LMKPQFKKHPCPECGRLHHTLEESRRLVERFLMCAHCAKPLYYEYVVKPDVWEAASMEYYGGTLHLECLEERLGRQLRIDDFAGPFGPYEAHRGNSINDAIRWAMNRGSEREIDERRDQPQAR